MSLYDDLWLSTSDINIGIKQSSIVDYQNEICASSLFLIFLQKENI